MPFIRHRRTRRLTRRKPKALMAVRRLAKFVDTELHVDYGNFTLGAVPDTGSVTLISSIAQGDDFNDRSGSQLACRSLELRMHADRGTGNSAYRMLVVVDKQTNGALATVVEILQAIPSSPFATTAFPNQNTLKRFTIVSDRLFMAERDNDEAKAYRWRVKLTHKIRYSGNGGLIGDIVGGSVLLVAISDQGAGGGPTLSVSTKLKFAP